VSPDSGWQDQAWFLSSPNKKTVIRAEAGIQETRSRAWIPTLAEMTDNDKAG
jgi:hypothetical protein